MAKPRNKYVDLLAYLGLRTFAMFAHMFSVRTNYRTVRCLAELLWLLDKKHRRIACGHLRLSFPDWPEEKVESVARESFRQMFYLGIDLLFTPRLITQRTWARHVRLKNLTQTLRLLIRNETGMLVLTGHYGGFEVVGYTMATLGFPSVSVFRPLDNPYINEYVMGVRERTGQSLLYKKGATATMDDVLEAKGTLAFIADQDAGRKGLFVDFFGRPASTYKTIALMAVRRRCPVVIGYGRRLSDKYEFEIGIQRVILPQDWQGQADEVTWITQEFSRELENVIRAVPEQYWWVHRRWKHRPDGSKADGDGVA
jgi:KDO2-lipid IV(A) lauroyltransferase